MTSVGFKKFVFSLLLVLLALNVNAQFTKASLGINGLTCSQCSRSVEMGLRKLSFIKDVNMDLEHTEATVTLSSNAKADFSAIAKAVKDAGFSLRFLKVEVNPREVWDLAIDCMVLRGDAYKLIGPMPDRQTVTLKFIGKDYLPKEERKRFSLPGVKCRGQKTYYVIAE